MAATSVCASENCKSESPEEQKLSLGILSDSSRNIEKKDSYSERLAFYKKPIKKNNVKLELDLNDTPQEIRRQRILYYQKQNRDASFDAGRGILENVLDSENAEEMEAEEEQDDMEIDVAKKRRHKVCKEYSNMCMLSEWMLEVPQDFAEKWIMVPCPVGKRVIVVAYKGLTKMYTRKGVRLKIFKSVLPGGSARTNKNSFTILDCIWNREKEIFYVLDVLSWSNQEMLNCDTEFRFYWAKTQIQELTGITEVKEGCNNYPFIPLPTVPCFQNFDECLKNISDSSIPLDGLLFYHKETHYTTGKTPLVVWLKSYMLPEVLGMSVPEPYDEKPDSYIDFEHHVLGVIQMEKNKLERIKKQNKKHVKSEEEDME